MESDFVILENDIPVLALEVKSNRSKKVPTNAALNKAGLACPRGNVNQDNLDEFLMTLKIEDLKNA